MLEYDIEADADKLKIEFPLCKDVIDRAVVHFKELMKNELPGADRPDLRRYVLDSPCSQKRTSSVPAGGRNGNRWSGR
jgi:hypothetical protein